MANSTTAQTAEVKIDMVKSLICVLQGKRKTCSYLPKEKTHKLVLKYTNTTFTVLLHFLLCITDNLCTVSVHVKKKKKRRKICRCKPVYIVKVYRNIPSRTSSKQEIKSVLAGLAVESQDILS